MVLIAHANGKPQAHPHSLARAFTVQTSHIELDYGFVQKSDI